MSKYDPLTKFLQSQAGAEVRLGFAEIEALIGGKLPQKSKANRAWWSNNPSNNVMTRAWLAAGYRSAQVDIAGERLTFVHDTVGGGFGETPQATFDGPKKGEAGSASDEDSDLEGPHPLFGIWKGKVTLLPDYDYTQPTDPDWDKVYGD